MPDSLDLNLEDTLIPPGTPPEGTLPNQQPAQETGTPDVTGEASLGSQAQQPASLPPGLLSRAQQLGLPLDGIDSTEKFNEYLLDQYANLRPYADYGRSALSQSPAQYQAGRQADQGEQAVEEHEFDEDKYFSEAWTVPQLSPGAKFALEHGAFETSDNGMIVPAKGLEQIALPYIKEINDYQQAKLSQNEAFAANPVRFLAEKLLPYFQHKFSPQFQSMTEQRFEQLRHENFETHFREEHKGWLYTPDGMAFTPQGQQFVETVRELRAQGITDPQKLANYAMKIAGINPQPQAPAQPAQPAATNPQASATNTNTDQRQRDNQGRFLPAGTPAPEPPKSKQESFLDEVRRKATTGASQSGRIDTSDSVVANEGDLEGLWTEAWKAYAGAAA